MYFFKANKYNCQRLISLKTRPVNNYDKQVINYFLESDFSDFHHTNCFQKDLVCRACGLHYRCIYEKNTSDL